MVQPPTEKQDGVKLGLISLEQQLLLLVGCFAREPFQHSRLQFQSQVDSVRQHPGNIYFGAELK